MSEHVNNEGRAGRAGYAGQAASAALATALVVALLFLVGGCSQVSGLTTTTASLGGASSVAAGTSAGSTPGASAPTDGGPGVESTISSATTAPPTTNSDRTTTTKKATTSSTTGTTGTTGAAGPGASIFGTVLDTQGVAVGGAKVRVVYNAADPRYRPDSDNLVGTATADSSGRFEIATPSLQKGSIVDVTATADGHTSVLVYGVCNQAREQVDFADFGADGDRRLPVGTQMPPLPIELLLPD